jgi:hypothetical protein
MRDNTDNYLFGYGDVDEDELDEYKQRKLWLRRYRYDDDNPTVSNEEIKFYNMEV